MIHRCDFDPPLGGGTRTVISAPLAGWTRRKRAADGTPNFFFPFLSLERALTTTTTHIQGGLVVRRNFGR